MAAFYPPTVYFPNINFNNDFYAIPNDPNNNQGISLSYANSHYLLSTGTATSTATTTFFSGNIGIGTTASTYQLDIYAGSNVNVARIQPGSTNGFL